MSRTIGLSNRGANAPASPIRRLMPHAEFARSRGVHVHHLNIGQPDLATVAPMLEAYRLFDEPVIAYSPSEGFPEYRQALADYYNRLDIAGSRILPEHILVTVGGSEALLFAIAATCDPGDQLLVVEPYYTNYRGFAHLLGVEVVPVTTHASEDFHLSADRVRAAIGPRVRALVVPTPGNPTGMVLRHGDLAEIGQVCVESGIFFIVDEVYREFVYPEDEEPATLAPSVLEIPDLESHAIVIDSVSKRYSGCGVRIGCLVTRNPELRSACLRFAQARLSPPTIDQYAAAAALRTPAHDMQTMIDAYRERRDLLVEGLNSIPGVSCPRPKGAFYLIADLPVEDAEHFCVFLLRSFDIDGETLMMAPAEGFYATPGAGRNQVRLAYVLSCEKLVRCLTILREGLLAYAAIYPTLSADEA